MKRLVLILVLVLAGCAGGADTWGGYTESEAKDVLADPVFKEQVLANAPGDPATSPIRQLYPTPEQAQDADLKKVTYEGQESWQWRHADEDFCVLVWEDPETEGPTALVSRCVAD